MQKNRQLTLCLAIAAFTLIGVTGCQSGSRFAMFGKPKAIAQPETTRTVSHSANADDRLADSSYTSADVSRLGGTSISHLPAGRAPTKKKTRRAAGPTPTRPGGMGSRSY